MEKARKPQIKEPDLAIFKLPLWKRVFDIIFSSMALLCLSPIFIITVIWIKLEDKGPAFYKSKRVGSNYKVFDFYKTNAWLNIRNLISIRNLLLKRL